VIEAAERGEATTITKTWQACRRRPPGAGAKAAVSDRAPEFAALLMGIPHAVETERDTSPLREIDL
jgi:hypothetical protein